MAIFPSRPLPSPSSSSSLSSTILIRAKKQPFLFFGLPFLGVMVAGSFGLQALTRTRYDYREVQMQSITKEDELHMSKDRKKLNIKDEYYRLQNIPSASSSLPDEWENVRVPRPSGTPQWGAAPAGVAGVSPDVGVVGRREGDHLV